MSRNEKFCNVVRVTSTESYFVSEGLYSNPDDLENTKEVTLLVITIGYCSDPETPEKKDDLTSLISLLKEELKEDIHYILDVDLDFFSTRNPFLILHSRSNLYEKLKPLYAFTKPANMNDPKVAEKVGADREVQLNELESAFKYLEQHRKLDGWLEEKAGTSKRSDEDTSESSEKKKELYESLSSLVTSVTSHYADDEIDWELVHDAGCTCDDTDLPHHVTTRPDIDRMVDVSFKQLLLALPKPPTAVTISRSSEDDYCPPEDVEYIQEKVLKCLQDKYSIAAPTEQYLED